jgi:hypothetical protein
MTILMVVFSIWEWIPQIKQKGCKIKAKQILTARQAKQNTPLKQRKSISAQIKLIAYLLYDMFVCTTERPWERDVFGVLSSHTNLTNGFILTILFTWLLKIDFSHSWPIIKSKKVIELCKLARLYTPVLLTSD